MCAAGALLAFCAGCAGVKINVLLPVEMEAAVYHIIGGAGLAFCGVHIAPHDCQHDTACRSADGKRNQKAKGNVTKVGLIIAGMAIKVLV